MTPNAAQQSIGEPRRRRGPADPGRAFLVGYREGLGTRIYGDNSVEPFGADLRESRPFTERSEKGPAFNSVGLHLAPASAAGKAGPRTRAPGPVSSEGARRSDTGGRPRPGGDRVPDRSPGRLRRPSEGSSEQRGRIPRCPNPS